MNQITIYELLPLLKPGFCVCTHHGIWLFYSYKPEVKSCINFFGNKVERWQAENARFNLSEFFNIAPFAGDWKDSLMECGKGLRAACHNYQRAKKALEGK